MAFLRRLLDFRGGNAVRVLALASQKGGSGKTTLSGHLAVQAQLAGAGPVVLIDIDPQGSLADWWNERETDLPAFAQTTVARLANDLAILRQQGFKLAVIDTPRSEEHTSELQSQSKIVCRHRLEK